MLVKLKGIVSSKTATTFQIFGLTVNFSSAEIGSPTWSLTLLGITADLSGSVTFENDDETPISRDAFFAAVVPSSRGNPGTIVKVKGSCNAGTITADKVELED